LVDRSADWLLTIVYRISVAIHIIYKYNLDVKKCHIQSGFERKLLVKKKN